TAYTLYNKSAKAGLFASVAVMGAGTFALGWGSELFYTLMLPSTIATPILLLAVLLALKARLFLSMCLCATAALMHPLMGIETAGIIIGTILVPATVLGSNMLETI